MIGITPPALTLIGICVFCPPYIFLPLICFAYWTGTLRSDISTKTMSPNITTKATANITRSQITETSFLICEIVAMSDEPADERIPTKIKSDNPLPIPRSVILSPSQTVNIPPAIRITTTTDAASQSGAPSHK